MPKVHKLGEPNYKCFPFIRYLLTRPRVPSQTLLAIPRRNNTGHRITEQFHTLSVSSEYTYKGRKQFKIWKSIYTES